MADALPHLATCRMRASRPVGRSALLAAAACALTACASAPGPESLKLTQAPADAKRVHVVIATTRARLGDDFTNARADKVDLQSYTISIPLVHAVGAIEWPGEAHGDPSRSFHVSATAPMDRDALARAVRSLNNPGGEVAVFVHGYNVSYPESVFRVAELANDVGFTGVAMGFAWPSEGSLTGYLADRDSATFSRDYLEQFLNDIAAMRDVKKVTLVAHSMGNWLALETLRQAKMKSPQSPLFGKLDEVVLIAPDVDLDVFRTELHDIGKLRRPIYLLVSTDDKALSVSQALADDAPRVGNLDATDPRLLGLSRETALRIVDLSNLSSIDEYNHSKFLLAAPQLHAFVQSQHERSAVAELTERGMLIVDAAALLRASNGLPRDETRYYR